MMTTNYGDVGSTAHISSYIYITIFIDLNCFVQINKVYYYKKILMSVCIVKITTCY